MPNNANRGRNIIREKKWFIGVISLVLVIGLGVFFALRSNNLGEPVTYVSLSVNPEIEFTVDSRNRVVSVEAINADAEQIVLNEDFIGMDIEDAAQRFTQHCIELGFITTEEEPEGTQNEVRITVVNADEEVENELRNKLQERLQKHFDNKGIFGKVSQETLELYVEDAVLSGRSVGHIKLIMRALEFNPQFTFNELKKLPVNEVVTLTKEKHDSLRDVSKEMKTLLELELNNLKTSAKYNLVFVELGAIRDLDDRLEDETLTEEQRLIIEAELEEKEDYFDETYGELYKEYKTERKEMVERYKEESKEMMQQRKEAFKQLKEQNKGKLAKHLEKIENDENLLDKIRNWRNRN